VSSDNDLHNCRNTKSGKLKALSEPVIKFTFTGKWSLSSPTLSGVPCIPRTVHNAQRIAEVALLQPASSEFLNYYCSSSYPPLYNPGPASAPGMFLFGCSYYSADSETRFMHLVRAVFTTIIMDFRRNIRASWNHVLKACQQRLKVLLIMESRLDLNRGCM
jgi:hypothetical protein